MRLLIVATTAMLSIVCAQAMEANTVGKRFARDAFISAYMDAVRQNPKIAVSQLAYLLAVTSPNSTDKSVWEKAAASIPFNEQLSRIASYLPKVGIGVGLSSPLGSAQLSASLTVSYNLNSLISTVFRGISGMMSPEEVEKTVQYILYINPSQTAALGGLTWDAWTNTGDLREFHSMYAIISQYTSQVPAPDAPPSAYIEVSSAFVTPFYHQLQSKPGVADSLVRNDWDAFIGGLPRRVPISSDPHFGTPAIREAVLKVASANAPAGTPLVLNAFSQPSTDAIYSLDPELDQRIRHWFSGKTREKMPEKRRYADVRSEWLEVQELLHEAAAIASAFSDPGSQRAVLITEQMVKLTYSVEMLNAAETSLQKGTATLGIVSTAITLFETFSRIMEPNKPSPERLLLEGQQKILGALSEISLQIHDVAVTLACVQRQLGALQFAISTDFAIERRELRSIGASLAANRAELLAALENSMLMSSMSAAEALRNDAQTQEVVAKT
jgi:hypothetical protein